MAPPPSDQPPTLHKAVSTVTQPALRKAEVVVTVPTPTPPAPTTSQLNSSVPSLLNTSNAQEKENEESDQNATSQQTIQMTPSEKRSRMYSELLSTEQSYFSQLEILQRNYLQPLSQVTLVKQHKKVTREQMEKIIKNVELIRTVTQKIHAQLTERLSTPFEVEKILIGDIFLNSEAGLRDYSHFSIHYEAALALLVASREDPTFSALLKVQDQRLKNGLDFQDYLIVPIQRLPR